MKKLTILIFCSIFLFSCEEVIEIEVPSGEPKLVIDATFEVFFDDMPVTANTIVKLRLSTDYFDDEIPIVTDAMVTLENLSNNTIINFEDTDLDGNYTPTNSFIPEDSVEYELTITYDNETYKGKATKVKSTPIDNIQQGNQILFDENDIELEISFTDNSVQENYYLFNFDSKNFISIEDRFFNGSEYNFSYFYDTEFMDLPTDTYITFSGITKEYFTYFRVLQNQSGQNGGGPFQTTPSSLLGNIVNTTAIKNFPLGYFHISETDTYTLTLTQ